MQQSAKSLADWLARLETFSPLEIELGLERVHAVLARLGPSLPPTVLTIAGTNGKGSSVVMASALLSDSGLLVGSYTSPHIVRFNERIRIAGEAVSDAEIIEAFEAIEAVREGIPLTYFEYGTIAAVLVFAARAVDVAILEVGMGGRLDAVNAIDASAALITNVSLDHCDWLGDDVEAIAFEKAGVMRARCPCVFASTDVPESILSRAVQTDAMLLLAGRDYSWHREANSWSWRGKNKELNGLELPALQGEFQLANAAGVLALAEAAGFEALLQAATVSRAFASVRLDGRMQSVNTDRHWILDVAHNPAAARVLSDSLAAPGGGRVTVAIVAMLDDKDVDGVIAPLAPMVDNWVALTAESGRAIAAAELARRIANVSNRACLEADSMAGALEYARAASKPGERVLITGSFYVVGPALQALGIY